MTSQPPPGSLPFPLAPSVIFANWLEVLHGLGLSKSMQSGFEYAIRGYLDYCHLNGLSVSLESARAYMADAQRRQLARNPALWKEALNWFFRRGRKMSAPPLPGTPSSGQADTGKSDCA